MPRWTGRRERPSRRGRRAPSCAEPFERRLLLHGGHHHLAAPAALDFQAEPPPIETSLTAAAPAAGARLPDLLPVVDAAKGYVYGWEYDTKQISGRTLLRLTTAVGNGGAGPMEIRGGTINPDDTQNVFQRVFLEGGGFTDRLAGTFTYHPSHRHTHFDDFAAYRLRPILPGGGAGEIAASGEKVSFCLLDTDRYAPSLPGSPALPRYMTCDAFQGISVGWADVYDKTLPDQWIDVTDLPDGRYWLDVVIDPDNSILESDETNNLARVPIDLLKPSQAPYVTWHLPAGQYPSPVSAVEFHFDQPMNPASFDVTHDVRSFTGPGGADLRGEITGSDWVAPMTLRVSFHTRATDGQYALTIGPDIRAADDGAPMDQDRDKITGEATADEYSATFRVTSRVGPDAFGYEARATPFEPLDLAPGAAGVFTIIDNDDDGAAAVPLGANAFNFYGTNYTGAQSLFVSTNGLITFTRGVSAFRNSNLASDPTYPAIAPLWDDWRTDVGGADVVLGRFDDTGGDTRPDRLVIEWSNVRRYVADPGDPGSGDPPADDTVTFQAILALNTGPEVAGAIVFNYPDVATSDANSDGANATVGIKGAGTSGANRLLIAYDDGRHPFVASGRAVRIARPPAAVVGRHVFYNHSAADGNRAAADPGDDAAIAPDKTALLPGAAVTFAHYTTYSRGLNGIMVDVAGLPAGTPTAADFDFGGAPAPSGITVRRGAGAGSSDRVTLVWNDGAILNRWLNVTVLSTARTGLPAPDAFAFGNLAGDTGDAPAGSGGAAVTALDLVRVRGHLSSSFVPLTNPYDHNRDGRVNGLDLAAVRANQFQTLRFAAPFAAAPLAARTSGRPSALLEESPPASL